MPGADGLYAPFFTLRPVVLCIYTVFTYACFQHPDLEGKLEGPLFKDGFSDFALACIQVRSILYALVSQSVLEEFRSEL